MSAPSSAHIRDLDSTLAHHVSDQRRELEGRIAVKYLTVQEITYADVPTFGNRLDALMEALLSLEAADSAVEDPDLAADVSSCRVDVEMTVQAADPAAALAKALAIVRAAIHAIGDVAPGWETTGAVVDAAPTETPQQLLARA